MHTFQADRQPGSTRCSRRQLLAASLLTPAVLALPEYAFAAPAEFSAKEAQTLKSEGSVERRFELKMNGRAYLSALSYCRIDREASDVFALLSRPKDLRRALPVTRNAEFLKDGNRLHVVHGTMLINGGYTLNWNPDPEAQLIRFWLDPAQPHDVDDVIGYFRVQPAGSGASLLTVGVAVDTGDSVVASVFKNKIHDYMSRPARYIARYVHRQPAPSRVTG